jgi:hypothetical protein
MLPKVGDQIQCETFVEAATQRMITSDMLQNSSLYCRYSLVALIQGPTNVVE